jgi:hypothetical protein
MDEMLSMALWIMIAFTTISASVVWFNSQSDISQFNLGLNGYTQGSSLSASNYTNIRCEMTSLFEVPGYAICFLNQLVSPILGVVEGIWKLLTNWSNLVHAILVNVPGGSLFELLIIPFLTIIEIGAAIVILMRLAAIVRGVAGGFL